MVTYALNTRCRNCIWIQTTRGIGACIKWSVAHTFIMSSLLATIVHSAGSILTTYLFDTSSWFSSCCFCCFDFRCSCFRLVPKTLTAQWNQPPWCWSVLRFISFRLGNGQQLNLKVLKSIWLRWFFVGFMLSYNAKLCQAYFAQNRQLLAIEIFERRILSKCLRMVIFYKISI